MADHPIGGGRPLKIIHVLRAPVGGLFRHVLDLGREQIAQGHAVGMIADSSTGGSRAADVLNRLEPDLALGLIRIPMRRQPAPSDVSATWHALRQFYRTAPDVIHGHGSKGGIYARLPRVFGLTQDAIRAYTPHGGSLNYQGSGLLQRLFMPAEQVMARHTDLLLCESAFIAERYRQCVGQPRGLTRIIHNGIGPDDFWTVTPQPDAADFLYMGELRFVKGIDTLIDALALVGHALGKPPRTVLVGGGPDREALQAQVRRLGLESHVRFAGPMPARQAYELGRILIVPSRLESLPYVVLEAAAAHLPMIATNVGGIPEIFGAMADRLIAPNDPNGLALRMMSILADSELKLRREAEALAQDVRRNFSIGGMAAAVVEAYRDAMARGRLQAPLPRPEVALSS